MIGIILILQLDVIQPVWQPLNQFFRENGESNDVIYNRITNIMNKNGYYVHLVGRTLVSDR